MDEWQELKEEKNRQQIELERQRAVQAAMASIDPVESKSQRAMQIQSIRERIEPFQEQIQQMINTWNGVVAELLKEIASATWGEQNSGRYSWAISSSIIWSEESQTPSLYWVALRRQPYVYAWYAVELRTDLDAQPVRFVIYCKESSYAISADLTVEALKSALVTAFKLGPLNNIFYESIPGVPIE